MRRRASYRAFRKRRQDAGASNKQARSGIRAFAVLTGFFAGDLSAFFARFGQTDGDGLFAARYPAALAAFAGAKRAALSSAHGTGDRLTCSLTVPAARTGFSGCHVVLLLVRFGDREKSLRDRAGMRPT